MAQSIVERYNLRSRSYLDEAKVEQKPLSPMRLVLYVVGINQVITAQLRDQLIVGRGSTAYHPDIDLSPLDGIKYGISRQHAIFLYDGTTLSIEDLQSTNGTRINGFKLIPGEVYPLHNDDELEIGRLRTVVRLVRAPG